MNSLTFFICFPANLFYVKWSEKLLSGVRLFVTPWTVGCYTPLSMEFSRPQYRNGCLLPSPGDLSNLGIEPRSPVLQVDSLPSEPPGKPNLFYMHSLSLSFDYSLIYFYLEKFLTYRKVERTVRWIPIYLLLDSVINILPNLLLFLPTDVSHFCLCIHIHKNIYVCFLNHLSINIRLYDTSACVF